MQALLGDLLERNGLDHDDLISIVFTATGDIVSMFPATAARAMGLGDVPLLCARELDVVGSTPRCLRVLLHVTTDRPAPSSTTSTSRGPGGCAMTSPSERRAPAAVVGTGLIGGSIGLALRARGWWVTGRDTDPASADRAVALGALDAVGEDPDAEITFVATPVGAVVAEVDARPGAGPAPRRRRDRRGRGQGAGGAARLPTPASSAATPWPAPSRWASTAPTPSSSSGPPGCSPRPPPPTPTPSPACAAVVTQPRGRGGGAVARRSTTPSWPWSRTCPHLTAATLMNLADRAGRASTAPCCAWPPGGFRDMTRIAAGQPGIWPDVCAENAAAIVAALDALLADLSAMRDRVAAADRAGLLERARARRRRRGAPCRPRAVRPERLVELRVPVPDRPGVLAEITTLAGDLGVNIADLEIAHSAEGDRGVLVLVVDADAADRLHDAAHRRAATASTARQLE